MVNQPEYQIKSLSMSESIGQLSEAEHDQAAAMKEVFLRRTTTNYCVVMDKFGDSLCQVVEHSPTVLSQETVAHLGAELVSAIESIHELGFVYNDLKPDNVLIGDESIKQLVS